MPTEFPRLRRELLASLALELEKLGFSRRGVCCRMPTDIGMYRIALQFIAWRGHGFDAVLRLSVRHEEVERMISPFLPNIPERLRASVPTLSASLESLDSGARWLVQTDSDLLTAIPSMVRSIQQIAMPFFSRYGSQDYLLRTLCGYDELEKGVLMGMAPTRAMRTLALSFLLGECDVHEDIRQRFLDAFSHRIYRWAADPHWMKGEPDDRDIDEARRIEEFAAEIAPRWSSKA